MRVARPRAQQQPTPARTRLACHSRGRWEDKAEPDGEGAQLRCIQEYLRTHPKVRYVWYECV